MFDDFFCMKKFLHHEWILLSTFLQKILLCLVWLDEKIFWRNLSFKVWLSNKFHSIKEKGVFWVKIVLSKDEKISDFRRGKDCIIQLVKKNLWVKTLKYLFFFYIFSYAFQIIFFLEEKKSFSFKRQLRNMLKRTEDEKVVIGEKCTSKK